MVKKWIKENKLRGKSVAELRQMVSELKDTMFTHRFQLSTGKLENHRVINETRRQLAAVLTLIREKEAAQPNIEAEVNS